MQVEYVDHMGNDDSVVNAARVSFNKQANQYSEADNIGLIKFLARGCTGKEFEEALKCLVEVNDINEARDLWSRIRATPDHWTPFAHTAITLRVKAPVPIRTQCFKHKQGLVENEESRRYVSYEPEIFVPDAFRRAANDAKQGSGSPIANQELVMQIYKESVDESVNTYKWLLRRGVCPEQARFVLPQGAQVNWVWTGNLYAFANFVRKRTDPHAQKEIQDLARMVEKVIAPLYPHSWNALMS